MINNKEYIKKIKVVTASDIALILGETKEYIYSLLIKSYVQVL